MTHRHPHQTLPTTLMTQRAMTIRKVSKPYTSYIHKIKSTNLTQFIFNFSFRSQRFAQIKSTIVDPSTIARSHLIGCHTKNAFYSSLVALQHSEGYSVRQHSGQIESHGCFGKIWSRRKWWKFGVGILLWFIGVTIQSTHTQTIARYSRICFQYEKL